MLKFLKNNPFIIGKCIGCIEMIILPDETWQYNFIVVKKKEKNQIEVIQEEVSIKSIEELKKIISNKIPVCLVINGKGIISKKVITTNDESEDTLIQKVLPNVLCSDFYVRSYPSAENYSFVSIIRRSLLESIIKVFADNKILIVESFWGPFVVNTIIPMIGKTSGELYSENYKFIINDTQVLDYTGIDDTPSSLEYYKIGEETIRLQSLISLSGLVCHFFENKADNSSKVPVIIESEKEFLYSRMLVKIGWAALISLFALLLINFFLFDHYNKKQQKLSGQVNQFSNLLVNQDTLKKNLETKQEMLEKSGLLNSSKISFYADRLSSIIKEGITLTKLSVNPVENSKDIENENESYIFKNDYIDISGTAGGSTFLNDWIKEMKNFSWVKEVTIKNYNQDNNQKPAIFTLEIKIDTK